MPSVNFISKTEIASLTLGGTGCYFLLYIIMVNGRKNEYIQKNNRINRLNYNLIICGVLSIALLVYV